MSSRAKQKLAYKLNQLETALRNMTHEEVQQMILGMPMQEVMFLREFCRKRNIEIPAPITAQ